MQKDSSFLLNQHWNNKWRQWVSISDIHIDLGPSFFTICRRTHSSPNHVQVVPHHVPSTRESWTLHGPHSHSLIQDRTGIDSWDRSYDPLPGIRRNPRANPSGPFCSPVWISISSWTDPCTWGRSFLWIATASISKISHNAARHRTDSSKQGLIPVSWLGHSRFNHRTPRASSSISTDSSPSSASVFGTDDSTASYQYLRSSCFHGIPYISPSSISRTLLMTNHSSRS